MAGFSVEVGADGIALITADVARLAAADIDRLAAVVEQVARETGVSGAILHMGRCDGLDLGYVESLIADYRRTAESDPVAAAAALQDRSGALSRALRRLETAGKPVVCALRGSALGAGLEVALACHHRIAEEGVTLGLDQALIGLMPMAGGTQRLSRLVGAEVALPLMLRGRTLTAAEASTAGIVDRVVAPGESLAAARAWLASGAKAEQPWDRKGFVPPGGEVFGQQGLRLWPAINALYRKETGDLYEARRNILDAVYIGLTVRSMDAGLRGEAQRATAVLRGAQARAMMRTFGRSIPALDAGARRPAGVPTVSFRRIGIVGAGFMGAGIATVSARAGLDVVLIDRDLETAEKGKAQAAAVYDRDIQRGAATADGRAQALACIATGTDYAALAGCDLVIEAVFENRDVKRPVLGAIDAALAPAAVIGTNTSTLPISSLAELTSRPKRFIGIHFFSPVDRMQLVEIIMGKETGDEALALALDFVRRIGKTPIVVNDSRGFFTSRVVMSYMAEGHRMLAEGVPAALIENAGRMAGMPVGPLALNDEVALDLAWKIIAATRADLGDRFDPGPIESILDELVNRRGRFGRKNGKGFYDYPPGERKRLWPGIAEIAPPRAADAFDVEEIKERLLLIQALETVRCLEEGVLTDPRDGDVGAILGFGYAPWTGGPLSWVDTLGVDAFVRRCDHYARHHGERYRASKALDAMAKGQKSFYS